MKQRKMILMGLIFLIMVLTFLWLGTGQKKIKQIHIGVSLYLEDDTFIDKILTAMETEALAYEAETGINVELNVSVANGSQRTQNEQVRRYIQLGYDAVCVNLVDRTSAAAVVDLAVFEGENIPVIFFNREPVEEDIMRRAGVYYVGSDAKESAILQGKSVVDAYERAPEVMDKNGDGILQYVMLEGEMGHQDTIMRSDYSLQRIGKGDIPLQQLAIGTADWSRTRAAMFMEQWVETYGEEIELVLCNNDDMALGALDTLEEKGMSAAVFGIDATEVGMEAVAAGKLWATVDCNGGAQGRAVLALATALATEGKPPQSLEIEKERYVRVPMEIRARE